jgi:dolichol-phosphate mannosyltransferase
VSAAIEDETLVVVPTFDEIESLPGVLRRLLEAMPGVRVLVVDDSSPDGTGEWAEDLGAHDRRVNVLHRPPRSGLGSAYVQGFRWGLDHGFGYLAEMDADGSHRPEELVRLLARFRAPDDPDLVIGSRWVPGGSVHGWPLPRRALSRAGNLYIRAMLGMDVADATAGFRVYRAAWLERSGALDEAGARGYGFQVEMTWAATRRGAAVAEVPIAFDERRFGASKLSGDIFTEELLMVTQWGIRRLLGSAGHGLR